VDDGPGSARRLLGVFAHPDDEVFCAGGTMARAAEAGAEVMIVSATRGERGQIRDAAAATRRTLGTVREGELGAAAAELGVQRVQVLAYPDGTLQHHRSSLGAAISDKQLAERLTLGRERRRTALLAAATIMLAECSGPGARPATGPHGGQGTALVVPPGGTVAGKGYAYWLERVQLIGFEGPFTPPSCVVAGAGDSAWRCCSPTGPATVSRSRKASRRAGTCLWRSCSPCARLWKVCLVSV
jgi:GlcNAc-PI de-N-acetylase